MAQSEEAVTKGPEPTLTPRKRLRPLTLVLLIAVIAAVGGLGVVRLWR